MLNNAIDHSGSSAIDVDVEVDVDARLARFIVSDEGVGAFESVRAKLALDSGLAALQEISKGKISTQPEHHSGEGIFFTSKMARTFELEANGLLWVVDNARHDQAISERPLRAGTTVRFEASLVETRKLEDIYAPYTHDFEFDSSRVVVKLFEHGVSFVSRSEAKRILAGLERFRHVILRFRRCGRNRTGLRGRGPSRLGEAALRDTPSRREHDGSRDVHGRAREACGYGRNVMP